MKSASSALLALLASRQFSSADLYEFDLVGGDQLNYTGGDQDISWNGIAWSSGSAGANSGPFFDRKDNKAKCHWKVGVAVDTLSFDVIPGAATIGGESFLSFVRQGGFDGAEMTLYRAFMPTYGNTAAGTVIMFVGRVAEVDASRSLATFTVNSHLELLNQQMPRNIYQSGCVNTLFDAGCTLNDSAFALEGSTASGSTQSVVNASLTAASGYYDLGQITYIGGKNAGFSRTIQSYAKGSPGSIALISPFPSVPAAGDAFLIYPGCDKSQGTCAGRFSNLINFRGFPYVPQPATSV